MAAGRKYNTTAPSSQPAGRSLPPSVCHQMEARFTTDFSDVRVHESHRATVLGARAFTQGNDIHFAPGAYEPHSKPGQELLGHELAHVVQQRSGYVQSGEGEQ